MEIVAAILQCGAFIIIPLATFGVDVWRILQLDEKYHRVSIAGLMGFISFEATIIGMIIDPRSGNMGSKELVVTSGIIGIATFLFVILFLPVAMAIFRIFKK